MTEISEQLLRQRIRENIIDYLETASSAEKQRNYEQSLVDAKAPGIVPVEMVEMWADSVHFANIGWYCEPVFSVDENQAIRQFQKIWEDVVSKLPKPMPWTINDLIGTPNWDKLMNTASVALKIFQKRGRFSRDEETQFDWK